MSEDFKIKTGDYLSFDSLSMKDYLVNALNNSGVFTDARYEGSNWNNLIDVFASFFGMYMFYLNQTSSELSFSQAQLYENMNRIVGMWNYSCGGKQTAILPFSASVKRDINGPTLANGVYTIPRYAFFNINGVSYSFTRDVSFAIDSTETTISSLSDGNSLFQGKFQEYPTYTGIGEEFEKLLLNTTDAIDHQNIHVYVSTDGDFEEWKLVESLYLEKPSSTAYEVRLNTDKKYEIRFGDDITGKKLPQSSLVYVFYLKTDGVSGEVGTGTLNENKLTLFSAGNYNTIMLDIGGNVPFMSQADVSNLVWTNELPSTKFVDFESVEDIRKHAPKFTRYKNFTTNYIEAFVDKNFKNLAHSTKVVGNADFITGHASYMSKVNGGASTRFLQNTINFSSSATFNNINIYVVPNRSVVDSDGNAHFVSDTQKRYILEKMKDIAIPTAEFVFQDPVYVEFDFGVLSPDDTYGDTAVSESRIVIIGDSKNKRNGEAILSDFRAIVEKYFSYENNELGGEIKFADMNYELKSISGVKRIYTVRESLLGRNIVDGISMVAMSRENPREDFIPVTANVTLDYWKFPYLKENTLTNKVSVQFTDIQ